MDNEASSPSHAARRAPGLPGHKNVSTAIIDPCVLNRGGRDVASPGDA